MSQFVRPAAWLRRLFLQSRTKHINPSRVSNEVSLVQAYDGGGWGMVPGTDWGVTVDSAVAAAGSTSILTVGEDEIFRLLGICVSLLAAAAPTLAIARVQIAVSNEAIAVSETLVTVDTELRALPGISTPILPPRSILTGKHSGGDATTKVQWAVLGLRLPLGSAPPL